MISLISDSASSSSGPSPIVKESYQHIEIFHSRSRKHGHQAKIYSISRDGWQTLFSGKAQLDSVCSEMFDQHLGCRCWELGIRTSLHERPRFVDVDIDLGTRDYVTMWCESRWCTHSSFKCVAAIFWARRQGLSGMRIKRIEQKWESRWEELEEVV